MEMFYDLHSPIWQALAILWLLKCAYAKKELYYWQIRKGKQRLNILTKFTELEESNMYEQQHGSFSLLNRHCPLSFAFCISLVWAYLEIYNNIAHIWIIILGKLAALDFVWNIAINSGNSWSPRYSSTTSQWLCCYRLEWVLMGCQEVRKSRWQQKFKWAKM